MVIDTLAFTSFWFSK